MAYQTRQDHDVPAPHSAAPQAERRALPLPHAYTSEPQTGMGKQIEQVLDVLYRRRWIVIVCFLLAAAAAAYHSATQQPQYQTSALIMIEFSRMPGGDGMTGAVEGTTPFVRSDRSIATELFILQNSYAIAQRVSGRLQELQQENPDVAIPPRGRVEFSPASRTVPNAIRVTATSVEPREAALLANLYAEEYVRQTRDASRGYVAASKEFLEEQEALRREELRRAEDRVEAYMRSTGSVGLSQESSALVGRIAALDAQRDEAQIDLQTRRRTLEALERELESVHPRLAESVSSGATMQMQVLQENLRRLEEERSQIQLQGVTTGQLSQRDQDRLASYDRQVASIQAEIRQLADRYVQEVGAVGGRADASGAIAHASELANRAIQQRIEIEGLEARLGVMDRRLGEHQSDLSRVPALSTELARLERGRAHAEQMYQYVVNRLQETEIIEASEPGYARILRQAGMPGGPMGPDRWRHLSVGLLIGLVLGIGLALLRDKIDNRIYKPDQLREQGHHLLSVIPDLRPLLKEEFRGQTTAEYEGHLVSTHLVTQLLPLATASEAYRHLRTAIQFSRPDAVVQMVLVTSSGLGEGKSTTAANLAVTMAQARRRTLIIDADLRRPRQHTLFGREQGRGLHGLLFSKPGTAIDPFLEHLGEDLYLLPAGKLPREDGEDKAVANPAELLGSRRMRELLEDLRAHFDVIVLDTPPVLAVTDAVLLSTQADATVMVASAGGTKEGDLRHGLELLESVGARVIGTILNGFDLSMAYGYRYSYGHYTRYGPYADYGPKKRAPRGRRGRRGRAAHA